jgi:hypothetical protein
MLAMTADLLTGVDANLVNEQSAEKNPRWQAVSDGRSGGDPARRPIHHCFADADAQAARADPATPPADAAKAL